MAGYVDFCGEIYPLERDRVLIVGREGDIAVDDNPYLHRNFLRIYGFEGFWWLENIGAQLSATVSDGVGGTQAYLPPGGRLPLVFEITVVRFSAGSTTYELEIHVDVPIFDPPLDPRSVSGETTTGRPTLTFEQRLLVVALAEPALRADERSVSTLPTSAEAAARLHWPITKFNRKLDSVCQKFARVGVRGLHGGPDQLASNRRFRLVEYALATRLIAKHDLELLESPAREQGGNSGSRV